MQALMKVAPGKGNLELREIPEPVAGPGEVVVRVAATGICGSDLHIQDDEYDVAPPGGHRARDGRGGRRHRPGGDRRPPRRPRHLPAPPSPPAGSCALCRAGRTNLCPQRALPRGATSTGASPPTSSSPRPTSSPSRTTSPSTPRP